MKNNLEKFRKEKNLSQEELAEILEVSRQTICSLEKGKYNPSILLAFKIAKFFKTHIENIFIYGDDEKWKTKNFITIFIYRFVL